ncbi:MAG: hypothetical protein R2752_00230 [Vicinamibacterales bacterium]
MAVVVRVAPVLAAVVFLFALIGRLAGWSPLVAAATLVVAVAGVAIAFLVLRRPEAASDAMASRVDADAGLAGELRSAHWFAQAGDRDDWADLHLARAAEHARQVSWDALYPPVRSGRAWAVTGGLGAAALAAMLLVPAPRPARPSDAVAGEIAALGDALPPELQAKLDELMAAMDNGTLSADAAKATLEDLKAMLDKLDPKLQEKLAELAKNAAEGKDGAPKIGDDPGTEENAAAGMPEDVKWALDDLASRLANADANKQSAENDNPSASAETGETTPGSAQAQTAEASAAEAGMQLMRQAATAAEASSQMMMSGSGAMGGDSSGGPGGNNPNKGGPVDFKSIAQALRQEVIEAQDDQLGKNIQTEDIRRKTEQGQSALGFTRVAPQASYAQSRATAPPTVPDARRPLVFHYFIRQR